MGPPLGIEDDGALGYVACCQKPNGQWQQVPCLTNPDSTYDWRPRDYGDVGSKERGIIQQCVKEHEQSEIGNGKMECKPDAFGDHRGEYEDQAEADKWDCVARRWQISCMKRAKDECEGDPTCLQRIDDIVARDQEAYDDKCEPEEEEEEAK